MDVTQYMNIAIERIIKDAFSIKKRSLKQLLFLNRFKKSSIKAAKIRKEYEWYIKNENYERY